MNQFASLVEANRYAYVGGNPVNTVDLTGFGLTDLVKKGANYVSDNIDRLTENAGGALVEKLYRAESPLSRVMPATRPCDDRQNSGRDDPSSTR